MKEAITRFLEQKSLSANSRSAYQYDLDQFLEQVGAINETSLRLYQSSLAHLKPSVQKRKLSALNQFLYFLYKEKSLTDYYHLEMPQAATAKRKKFDLLDLSAFWQESLLPKGRLMALLILETGLLPSEILALKTADIELEFHILSIEKAEQKRVLKISSALAEELAPFCEGTFLFDKAGKPYTRQWAFRQLESFLLEKGYQDLSAQSLREQYILQQLKKGSSLHEIAKNLGLKTTMTLEKYR